MLDTSRAPGESTSEPPTSDQGTAAQNNGNVGLGTVIPPSTDIEGIFDFPPNSEAGAQEPFLPRTK